MGLLEAVDDDASKSLPDISGCHALFMAPQPLLLPWLQLLQLSYEWEGGVAGKGRDYWSALYWALLFYLAASELGQGYLTHWIPKSVIASQVQEQVMLEW